MVHAREHFSRIEAVGGGVVAVGMGRVEQTAAFHKEFALPFPMVADPDKELFEAFRIGRTNLRNIAGPRVWLPSVKALVRRGTAMPVGDIWQMPGEFVIDRQGTIQMAHYPTDQADFAPWSTILESIEAANP